MPRALRQSVIVAFAAAAWGHPGAVSSSTRIARAPHGHLVPHRGFDVVQDRALAFGAGLAAGVNQPGKRVAHAGEFVDAQLQVIDPAAGHRPGFIT